MDVFTGAGEVVTTRPGDDLFDVFPNSYGSLGYATRLTIRLERVPGFVSLRHLRFDDEDRLAASVAELVGDRQSRRPPGRRPRRRDVPAGRVLPHPRHVDGRARPDVRLHRPADLLPLAPGAHHRPAHDARLPVALGHRLVLVLARLRCPAPCGPTPLAAAVAPVGRLHAAARARPALRHRRPARPAGGSPAARARRPGRRGPGRATGRVPRLVRRRGRDAAGLALPRGGDPVVADVPARARTLLRQRRLLGHRARRPRVPPTRRATGRSRPSSTTSVATRASTPTRSTTATPSTRCTTDRGSRA